MKYIHQVRKEFNYQIGVLYFCIDSNNKKNSEIKIQLITYQSIDQLYEGEGVWIFKYDLMEFEQSCIQQKYAYQCGQENGGQIEPYITKSTKNGIKKRKAKYYNFCLYASGEEFLIQQFLMLQQIEQNMDQIIDLSQMNINWGKKLFLMSTPTNWKIKKHNCQADELVMLLNQQVQQKINWEHEKILLNNKCCQQLNLSLEDLVPDCHPTKSEINIQFYINQLNESNSSIKQDIKTPELAHLIDASSPAKIQLEFSTQNKRQERDHIDENGTKCNCKKSQCLKLYCQCFRSGKQCKDCDCKGCKNNSDSHQERKLAIKMIQERQPAAFSHAGRYKGCRCTKSQCLKGYCECFLNGHICGKYCKCRECANNKKMEKKQKKKNQKNKH